MITQEKYKQILETGLSLDLFFLLCTIRDGIKPLEHNKLDGFINLLTKKEYLSDGILTEKAVDLVENECKLLVESEVKFNLSKWAKELHVQCQEKLIELTGSKQVTSSIDKGKSFSFLCNAIDLEKALRRVITSYKLKDFDKIEKAVLNHIEKCSSENNWFPLMQYFIIKNGFSPMVTAMDEEEQVIAKTSSQKFV